MDGSFGTMHTHRIFAVVVGVAVAGASLVVVCAGQLPLDPFRETGQSVTPASIAPMSLLTYQEVRPWARAIRQRVLAREMPPWHIARNVGLKAPARFENFQPHRHMRGKAMSIEAIYPDGRQEFLNLVDNFQWKWHVNYVYADDVAPILPKGTVIKVTAGHDNTAANRNNPDPAQWVGYGDRTVDEMGFAWVDVTYLEQEDYERLSAERAQRGSNNE